jgi:hypothetical protein
VASQERLEYFISAAFKDEGVRQAMQAFAKLNAESAKVVNELDRLAKAGQNAGQKIRDSRTGFAQVGMQINQFGTQVASGTSMATAFVQQIGDVGWSLSTMGGTLGKVGSILAGPWGIAIMGAVMGLKALWDATSEEEKQIKKLDDAFALGAVSAKNLKAVTDLLAQSNDKVTRSAYGAAVAERQLALNTLATAEASIAKLRAAAANKPQAMTGMMGVASQAVVQQLTSADISRLEQSIATARKSLAIQDVTIAHLNSTMDQSTRVQNAWTDGLANLQDKLNSGKINVDEFRVSSMMLQAQYAADTKAIQAEKEAQKDANREKREAAAAARKHANEIKRQVGEYENATDWLKKQINLYTSESTAVGKSKNKLEEYLDTVSKLRSLPGGEQFFRANEGALLRVQNAIAGEVDKKNYEDFQKIAESLSNKTVPEWKVKLEQLAEAYKKVNAEQHPDAVMEFNDAIDAVVGGPINEAIKKYDDLIAKSNGVDDSFEVMRQQFVDSIAAAQQMGRDVSVLNEQLAILDQKHSELKIAERNAEIRKSFESIGMSVNDAFKGMLTAGMSWKDGMKGIINAVIDELWRLFVVQQIVGMVKNVLGGFLGGGGGLKMPSVASQVSASDAVLSNIVSNSQAGAVFIPGTNLIDWSKTFDPIGKNANGTPYWQGGLTWVGERGPELVNLPRGAGVIPAHRASQMGSGGINITVDARGSADPAAVRAQVQQGILEAAPAIVAAAQQRTVAGLRRPKLGGAMQ